MDLDSMKYAELQKLAKELGLKANMKADRLLRGIKQHYEKEQDQHRDNNVVEENVPPDAPKAVEDCDVSVPSPASAFVNTRRGKGAANKRGLSAATGPAPEKSIEPADSQSAKKRRLALEVEVPTTVKESKAEGKVAKAGKIPRLQKIPLKPVTPNFKKLHEAEFNKMESIYSYFQRKTKQMETYKNSVTELKKPVQSRTSLFSPASSSKTQVEERRRHTLLSASKTKIGAKKSVGKEDVSFKPSILSTRRINVRFSEATKDNEYKKSLIKTPARMSPCVASSTPQEKSGAKTNAVKTKTLSASKTPGPFVFTGNTSTITTPGTQKKNAFDLKASLSRPLNYKPHTGKLKPFADTKEIDASNKSVSVSSHQKNYKQHKVQTRDDRREKHNENRKQKKSNLLGARRGLVMM
ncbi:unnamed protein product [Knipowitschia caucasica]|uniref:Nucleolar and spindle-associated protein 1 n=1 Tax=Knipowitschia caucasica TaxID=637954 RepID=A0AAV2JFY5_KNICA